jgi:hypothetical protein
MIIKRFSPNDPATRWALGTFQKRPIDGISENANAAKKNLF